MWDRWCGTRRRRGVVQIDNAPEHASGAFKRFMGSRRMEIFPFPPRSGDLAPRAPWSRPRGERSRAARKKTKRFVFVCFGVSSFVSGLLFFVLVSLPGFCTEDREFVGGCGPAADHALRHFSQVEGGCRAYIAKTHCKKKDSPSNSESRQLCCKCEARNNLRRAGQRGEPRGVAAGRPAGSAPHAHLPAREARGVDGLESFRTHSWNVEHHEPPQTTNEE